MTRTATWMPSTFFCPHPPNSHRAADSGKKMKAFLPQLHTCSTTIAQNAYYATGTCVPQPPPRARNVSMCSSKLSGNKPLDFALSTSTTKPICFSDRLRHEQ